MQKRKIKYRVKIVFGIFIILHILFAVYLGIQKINYHYDEYLTFSLANNSIGALDIENGKVYSGFSLYEDYLSVKNTERFDYKGVWKNQAADVHPPFYYVIIHTICSLFPGQFSKWFGIIPNIFFMISIDFLFFRLARSILKNDWLALVTTVAAGTSMLAMNMVIFIRMYEMMTFFVVGISLLFAVYYNKDRDWKFYTGCYLFAIGGTMTQYYFLIYLFFLCSFFAIRLLLQRKWKEILWFITAFAAAGASCILIFPAIVKQIFGGSIRGKQAFSAIQTFHNYDKYLEEYYDILNTNIFGGLFIWILLISVLLMIVMLYKKGWKSCAKGIDTVPVMLLSAGILYILLIAKIAPYRTMRYVMPIGWIFILFSVWFLYKSVTNIVNISHLNRLSGGILVMLLFIAVNALGKSEWRYQYDYANSAEYFDIAEEYSDCSVIYVYKIRSRTVCNAGELKRYKDYVFTKSKGLKELVEKTEESPVLIYIANNYDENEIIDTVLEADSHFEKADFLFKSGYAKVYYVE